VETEPQYLAAYRVLAAALLRCGRLNEAIAVLESALRSAERDPMLMAWLAHAHAAAGRHHVGRDLVQRLAALKDVRHVPAYHLAIAHAGLDDVDAAFAALHQAAEDADPALAFVMVEPRFEPLRSDARFARLKESLALQ
jgi:tetratricopeptide (TPR) repeat protein